MAHSTIVEGTGQELLHHLEQFPNDRFRLVPVPVRQKDEAKRKASGRSLSALGKYAFVAGGSENFAIEKHAEIDREDRSRG